MTTDEALALIASSGYQLGSLSQSPRGWEVIIWSGSIGYSTYTVATADSPALALTLATESMHTTGGTELDCNAPKIKLDLSAFLANLVPPPEPIKRRI